MSQRDELARAVMELIDRGHRGVSRHLDLTRLQVLATVAARGPVRPAAIAAELGLTASATSRHLTALEDAGRIAVEPDPHDARTFLVRGTGQGTAEIDTALRAGTAAFTAVVADWSDEEIATAVGVVTRLTRAFADRGARAVEEPARRGLRRRVAAPRPDPSATTTLAAGPPSAPPTEEIR